MRVCLFLNLGCVFFFLRLLPFCFKVCLCLDLRCERVVCVLFLNLGCGVFFLRLLPFYFGVCFCLPQHCRQHFVFVCLSFAFCSVLSVCEVLVAFHINIHRKHKTPEEGSNSP